MTGIPTGPGLLPPSVSALGSGNGNGGGSSAQYANHLAQLPKEEFQKVMYKKRWDDIVAAVQQPMRNLKPRNLKPPDSSDGDDGGGELDIEA